MVPVWIETLTAIEVLNQDFQSTFYVLPRSPILTISPIASNWSLAILSLLQIFFGSNESQVKLSQIVVSTIVTFVAKDVVLRTWKKPKSCEIVQIGVTTSVVVLHAWNKHKSSESWSEVYSQGIVILVMLINFAHNSARIIRTCIHMIKYVKWEVTELPIVSFVSGLGSWKAEKTMNIEILGSVVQHKLLALMHWIQCRTVHA